MRSTQRSRVEFPLAIALISGLAVGCEGGCGLLATSFRLEVEAPATVQAGSSFEVTLTATCADLRRGISLEWIDSQARIVREAPVFDDGVIAPKAGQLSDCAPGMPGSKTLRLQSLDDARQGEHLLELRAVSLSTDQSNETEFGEIRTVVVPPTNPGFELAVPAQVAVVAGSSAWMIDVAINRTGEAGDVALDWSEAAAPSQAVSHGLVGNFVPNPIAPGEATSSFSLQDPDGGVAAGGVSGVVVLATSPATSRAALIRFLRTTAVPATPLFSAVPGVDTVALSWNGQADVGSFRLERADGGGPFTVLAPSLAASVTSYVDSGLVPQTTYRYQLTAINLNGESLPATVSVTTLAGTTTSTATLTVSVTGNGTVTSVPAGIACPGDCGESFPLIPVTDVALTAARGAGAAFSGWSGACAGNSLTVQLAMDVSKSCTATFVAAGWQPVGPAVADSVAPRMSIAVDRSVALSPVLYAATTEFAAGRTDLVVRRFENNTWTPVGNNPINADALVSSEEFTPAIAIDAGGTVTVAWAENGRQLRVKQWPPTAVPGDAWVTLAENLNVDPSQLVFGTQIATAGSQLVVAWVETVSNQQGLGRMTVKRYLPGPQLWIGGSVLPAETSVMALRLTTEAAGNALLMYAPYDAAAISLEGPVQVLREDPTDVWTGVCDGLARPAANGTTFPNTQLGFGIAKLAFPASDPVAVFNNGEAMFALKCRGGVWTGLDGSAQGQVTTFGLGESFYTLAVAPGEGSGVAVAWTKTTFFNTGDRQFDTQVLVENSTSTGWDAREPALSFLNDTFASGTMSLTLLTDDSPVLGGLRLDGSPYAARVFRYLPP